jgi:cell wall assembly regulator SMI1
MQKFTRAITREIELAGERLALNLSEQGIALRPVGSRRPPREITWAALVHLLARGGTAEPTAEELADAVQQIRGGKAAPTAQAAQAAPVAESQPPAPAPEVEPEPPAPAAEPAPPAPAAERASKPEVGNLLARLERWLTQHRKRYAEGLLPGASAADLQGLRQALGVPLPEELRTLLAWHNGQSDDFIGGFERDWNLMTAQQIAATKQELDAAPNTGWQKAWVPFLGDGADNYLCLDTGQPGTPVRHFRHRAQEHPVIAPSLTAWLEEFVCAVERGDYFQEPERGTFLRRHE